MISIDGDDLSSLKVYELASDLLLGSALAGTQARRRDKSWQPLFSAKQFAEEHKDIALEDFQLSSRRLQDFGVKVSNARKEVLQKAKKLQELQAAPKTGVSNTLAASQAHVTRLDKKIARRGVE